MVSIVPIATNSAAFAVPLRDANGFGWEKLANPPLQQIMIMQRQPLIARTLE